MTASRPFKMTLLILLCVFGLIIAWNIVRAYIIKRSIAANQPIMAITAAPARAENWQPTLYAIGNLVAVKGVAISSQASGNVTAIHFQSGQKVKQGDILLQIDDRSEQAQLIQTTAALSLAQATYQRYKTLLDKGAVATQAFDEANSRYQQAQASVAQIQAILDYKCVRAPFDGVIGIRNVNLGQFVNPGDNLVTLQSLDPLYINFYLPEQFLHQLYVKQRVALQVDAVPKRRFYGAINAINPLIDVQTHNISLQASIPNPDEKLFPGLFANIAVLLPQQQHVVTVPQTAINYSLYGDTVYIVNKQGHDDRGDILTVTLREVTLGEQHDNKINITKGLKAGEWIVTSGQLKLSNNQRVVINNRVQP